jgi:hypothetical protein
MDAAFMSFQLHEGGIHAVWVRGWRGQWGEGLFPVYAAAGGEVRADMINASRDLTLPASPMQRTHTRGLRRPTGVTSAGFF